MEIAQQMKPDSRRVGAAYAAETGIEKPPSYKPFFAARRG
jgi:hypothetical protein